MIVIIPEQRYEVNVCLDCPHFGRWSDGPASGFACNNKEAPGYPYAVLDRMSAESEIAPWCPIK